MKKKVIAAAVAATLGHTAANAVSVNPNGLGEVLLFPYYTVQGSAAGNFDTLITLVNTTDYVKAVKIRFREAKASHEVLDFNIYMSPKDVWVAVVSPEGEGAKIATPDSTCTVPAIPVGGQPFRNSEYDPTQGGVDDGAGTGLDRTKEGYFEVIEMGNVFDTDTVAPASTSPSPFTPATWATHVPGGDPANCGNLIAAWAGGSWSNPPAGFVVGDLNVQAPTGGLFGSASLINVNEGTDYGYDAVALNDFFSPANIDLDLHRDPGTTLPTLADVDPKTSIVVNGNSVVTSDWGLGNPADPVSAVLMESRLMNDYVTEPGIDAATSFVYTMPTKNFYVPIDTVSRPIDAPPFTMTFFQSACEVVNYTAWDREENTERPVIEVDFSPRPPIIINPSTLCFEANVLRINNKDALSSQTAINDLTTNFINGWISADFTAPGHFMTADDGAIYLGLPVIGFSAQRYFNGTLTNDAGSSALSNYGGLFNHKGVSIISAAN